MEGIREKSTIHGRQGRHRSAISSHIGELTGPPCLTCLSCLIAFLSLKKPKYDVFPLEMKVLKRGVTSVSYGDF